MHLSIAEVSDYKAIQELVVKFHEESPYKDIAFKHAKVNEIIMSFLLGDKERVCIVLKDEGKAVGLIAGVLTEPTFCDIKIAHELVWYVLPEYRKGTWPMRLRKAFEYWSENVAKANITQMATVNNDYSDRLKEHYEKKGYRLFEMTYLKMNT